LAVAPTAVDATPLFRAREDVYYFHTCGQQRRSSLTSSRAVADVIMQIDLMVLADAPVFLGESAAARFLEITANERAALPETPLSLDAFT
jgi:hypothetical protein